MKKLSFFALALALSTSTPAKSDDAVTNLTIYGNSPQMWNMPFYYMPQGQMPGYAIVTTARQVSLASGMNSVVIDKLPEEIDPSSIMVKSLGRNLQIVEQSFVSSRVGMADVIKRNIGKQVEVEKYGADGVIATKGVLLDSSNGLIVKDGDKIKMVSDYSAVVVDDESNAPAGSSLKWLISSNGSADTLIEYSYKTAGIGWAASYDVYLDGKGTDVMAKIEGWANLINNTNINVKETNLKLIAGEVSQDNSGGGRPVPMMAMAKAGGAEMAMDAAAPSMQQQNFSDYHMYTIDRKISLPASSSKKIKLFGDKEGVLAKKKFVFEGSQTGDNSVKSVITFVNDEKSRLGMPMPGGKYRVFAKDASGAYEQAGETTLEHKAEGEKLELTIGNNFDLKATRTQVDTEQDQLRHRGKYTVTVEIESALEDETEVMVKEPIYQQNWEIIDTNYSYQKTNANLVEFKVPAKPKGKTKLQYVVQYSW